MRTGVVKVRSTCNKEIGSRLFWSGYLHKRETALQYTNKYHLYTYGLEARDLYELLHLLLDNNIFTYRNTTYRQIRGLAMMMIF